MATSKTLAPTNVTISIPAMADAPDASVFSNCVDKEADAINALNSNLANITPMLTGNTASDSNTNNLTFPDGKTKSNFYPICVGFYRNTNWVFNGAAYQIALTNSNIVLELNSGFEYFRGLPFVIMYR